MIRTEGASLVYWDHGREVFACREVGLEIIEGEFVGVLGPSGSGKSSLLFLLSGLKDPTSGSVFYNGISFAQQGGRERAELRLRTFGFIFQQPYLLGYLTAVENVMLGDPSAPNAADRALEVLEKLGLGDKARRRPGELSGGEKQRVCVARALFNSPRVIFADEPTASLDHAGGLHVVELLRKHRQGALVMVTHDRTMLGSADRVLMIEEGRLRELGAEERDQALSVP
ncbi:MAG: ATP-binding cassette domain-containing protein [Armatimonadetes bacterium]|nr:ATP-binding cassette domain-containing protein [Armatimonadota bacterium]